MGAGRGKINWEERIYFSLVSLTGTVVSIARLLSAAALVVASSLLSMQDIVQRYFWLLGVRTSGCTAQSYGAMGRSRFGDRVIMDLAP